MAAYTSEYESQEKSIISTTIQTTTPNYDHQKHEEDEEEVIVYEPKPRTRKPRKKRVPHVCLEGYVEPSDDDDLPRTKSLTDDDLDELKGCVDLGFGFSYDEIPELCNTLPALELCYSMSQKFLDDHPNQQQHHQQSLNHTNSTTDTASSSGSEVLVLCLLGRFLVLVIILKMSKRGLSFGLRPWRALSNYAARLQRRAHRLILSDKRTKGCPIFPKR